MKQKRNVALAVSVALLAAFMVQAADTLEKESQQAVADFLKKDSTLKTFMDDAAGYAVFPSVGKGGLVVGGARGSGLVYEKAKPVGRATMTQASIGAQIGGQTFAEIICFETAEALKNFKASKMEMSAEVSAVAASEGVGKAAKYSHGVAVFALPKKGLMAQASVGGQKFKYEPFAAGGTGSSQGKEENK